MQPCSSACERCWRLWTVRSTRTLSCAARWKPCASGRGATPVSDIPRAQCATGTICDTLMRCPLWHEVPRVSCIGAQSHARGSSFPTAVGVRANGYLRSVRVEGPCYIWAWIR